MNALSQEDRQIKVAEYRSNLKWLKDFMPCLNSAYKLTTIASFCKEYF